MLRILRWHAKGGKAVQRSADFDVDVSRVVLAHEFAFYTDDAMAGYARGRDVHGLVCVRSGQAQYAFSGGHVRTLSAGEIALLPASSAYSVRKVGEIPFLHYTVNFLGDAASLPDWLSKAEMHVLRPRDFARYLARFEELAETWRRMRTGYRMQAKAKLIALLADYLAECLSLTMDVAAYSRTLPAKRRMEERYSEPVSLEELAQCCGMSVSSFRRAFVAVYGQPPMQYLLHLRIEKARDFLLAGFPLEEIARNTGFADVNYFIRYFHKVMGVPPGRYRQMN